VSHSRKRQKINKQATCPSCGKSGTFDYAGDQMVPARVAQVMGLNGNVIPLWHCPACGSTISEPNLLPPEA